MSDQDFEPEPFTGDEEETTPVSADTLLSAVARFQESFTRHSALQPLIKAINGMPDSAPFPVDVRSVKIDYRGPDSKIVTADLSNIYNVGDIADLFSKEVERLVDNMVQELGVISQTAAALQAICQSAQYAARMRQNNFMP